MFLNLLILALVLLAVGAIAATAAAYLMAVLLLRPPRMTDARAIWRLQRLSPGDLHLRYADMPFTVRDDATGQPLKLAAWWIPHPANGHRTAIVLHGYADAKVGAIAWAPTFHALGFHVLALDLRAHGESDGRYCTAGYLERHDLSQVIDQLRQSRPGDTRQLVLFGVSLGAAVASATAAMRDDLSAVILDCPYADYALAAASHTAILGGPGGAIQRWSVRWAQRIAGADFSAVRPVDTIPKIPCPVLVIRSESDVFIDDQHAAMVEAAVQARPANLLTEYWNAANAHHVAAIQEAPEEYRQRIAQFLEAARVLVHTPPGAPAGRKPE